MAEWAEKKFDFFISHASEDKEFVVSPLFIALKKLGLRVWFDSVQISPGDRLRGQITDGLRNTHCGIVVLSPSFFEKEWTQIELNALLASEEHGTRIIPLLHEFDHKDLQMEQPLLADYFALDSKEGTDSLAIKLSEVAQKKWFFKPLYVPGEYQEDINFPFEVFAPAIRAIEELLDPINWGNFNATEDVSQTGVWMASNNKNLVSVGFRLFRPLLIFAHRESALERGFSGYDERSSMMYELLRVSYEAWLKDFDFANRYGLPVEYNPRVSGWRRLREKHPAKYLLQGQNRKEVEAVLSALATTGKDIATLNSNEFDHYYQRAFEQHCVGYKEIGLLFNALFRFRPADRPVFVALLGLFHALWSMILAISEGQNPPNHLDNSFLDRMSNISELRRNWPNPHNGILDDSYVNALHKFLIAQLPNRFLGLRSRND